MGLKEHIKDIFNDKKKLTDKRYESSKLVFVLSSLLFFINFYFVGGHFYTEILVITLGYTYILLLLSLILYVYYFIKKMLLDKIPNYVYYIILLVLTLLFLFLLLPIIFNGGITDLLNLFNYI